MKRALLIIDYTVDFVADEGALTCGAPGQAIENRILSLIEEFLQNGDEIIMAVDLHEENDPDHPETKLYPPHNIRGTHGRDLYGGVQTIYEQNKERMIWMDKTRYSSFTGTDLDIRLRAKGITEVHLTGVCTDICVLHTAVDAYNRGFQVVIHEDAVQSFSSTGHEWALQHFKNAMGATVVSK
ncbi:cysteine hydrolase [Brevibacillus laterosporus]|uniref:cysteine hydrolase family protein n=1 Tax=Brevibacillus laterosporus TaxID=1465 RepID=UPI00215C98A6|nr:isochorismatase family cysteine hydrolase [Brevibacillus laterosporus]MCR8935933.1 cysteine hydrolase [Brevibacillus laterosporus]MCZ0838572.1 cysteine hydrolase [Brevibacillus laterosporus]MCZ0843269.1 cysteine hydrolase [Brevibacillus laterosporus]